MTRIVVVMSATVTIDAQAATWLVAHALAALDGGSGADPNEPGCCPECCGPCGALLILLDAGQLDDIARPYGTEGGGTTWWDAANDRVDREWLARGWRNRDCVEDHDEERTVPVVPAG